MLEVTLLTKSMSLLIVGLHFGGLITAEIKAPWVILQSDGIGSTCSALAQWLTAI